MSFFAYSNTGVVVPNRRLFLSSAALLSGAAVALYAEIFPIRVRYTALSLPYNIAVAIFGGFAPFIATYLIQLTGSTKAPAIYVISAAIVTLIILLKTRERAFQPLR